MKFSDNRNLESVLIREENLNKQEGLDDLKEWCNWNGITFKGIKWYALYLRIYKTYLGNKSGAHQFERWGEHPECANYPQDLLPM